MKTSKQRHPSSSIGGACIWLILAALPVWAPEVAAQNAETGRSRLLFTRIAMTGTSDQSDPEGYKAYSSIHFEPALRWHLSRRWAAELRVAHESREIDFEGPEGETSLGSAELLPIDLTVQVHVRKRGVCPYLGVGYNYTVFWERSGELNPKKFRPSSGPLAQIGCDIPLSERALFNIDIRQMTMKTEFDRSVQKDIELRIDPMVLSVGLGFRL